MTDKKIPDMTCQKPHLIAMFQSWFGENGVRTFLVVEASLINSSMPLQGVQEDGNIVLNIGMEASPDFTIHQGTVSMSVRFGGRPATLSFQMDACRAVFSPDNGIGVPLYEPSSMTASGDTVSEAATPPVKKGPPKLSIVH